MAEEYADYRHSSMRRGLSFVFTLMTWVTIAPLVCLGLILTALYAYFFVGITPAQLTHVAVIGAILMGVCAIPGQWLWREQFRTRVLRPLRNLGAVMVKAGSGAATPGSGRCRGGKRPGRREHCGWCSGVRAPARAGDAKRLAGAPDTSRSPVQPGVTRGRSPPTRAGHRRRQTPGRQFFANDMVKHHGHRPEQHGILAAAQARAT